LNEIHTALELAPNDPVVREIAENISYLIPDGMIKNGNDFDFPWLTQTPTALPPTLEIVLAEESTATPEAVVTDTVKATPDQVNPTQPNPTPVPQRPTRLCGSIALVPLMLVIWFVRKKEKNF
jgi:hypothetical protein